MAASLDREWSHVHGARALNIFVTVGSMLPFDRLIRAMDLWAAQHPDSTVTAQIGRSKLRPNHLQFYPLVTSSVYLEYFLASDVVVSHAGMGTFITALERRKPLVMLPRRYALQEHTSDHQLATANWLKDCPGVEIVFDENQLGDAISRAIDSQGVAMSESGSRAQLIATIRKFIEAK